MIYEGETSLIPECLNKSPADIWTQTQEDTGGGEGLKKLKGKGKRKRCTSPPVPLKSIWFLAGYIVTGAQVTTSTATQHPGAVLQDTSRLFGFIAQLHFNQMSIATAYMDKSWSSTEGGWECNMSFCDFFVFFNQFLLSISSSIHYDTHRSGVWLSADDFIPHIQCYFHIFTFEHISLYLYLPRPFTTHSMHQHYSVTHTHFIRNKQTWTLLNCTASLGHCHSNEWLFPLGCSIKLGFTNQQESWVRNRGKTEEWYSRHKHHVNQIQSVVAV